MGTGGASGIDLSGFSKEGCSETTVEIKIKTLDSQTYTLRVDKYVPVTALKEQIAGITGVLSEQQRLICRGKVLKDDQLLSAYHVEDGHTLHLVVRQPLDSSSTSVPGNVGSDGGHNSGSNLDHDSHLGNSVGSTNLSEQGVSSASNFSRIFSSVIGSLGISSFGMTSSREQAYERNRRTSGRSGLPESSQTQADQASARSSFDSYLGGFRFPSNASLSGNQHPTVIPDSCTTLTRYLDHIRDEFISNGRGFNSNTNATDSHGGVGQDSRLHSAVRQGLPTPASLVEVILSARQLLMENAADCLSDLATQLQGQENVTDPHARANIQSNAMRSGVLIQNLGPLFLELGRTIMTLRMGQTREEAIINAGPAIFVSASGPNPIMVQAGTTFGGISMGASHPGQGSAVSLGPGIVSRNIDITIRRAQGSDHMNGETSGPPPAERTDSANTVHQALQGISGRASTVREPTVRVVPIRTVIAIPGANHRSSDSSGSDDTSLHPLFARLQQIPGNMNDARNPLVSGAQRIDRSNQQLPSDFGSECDGGTQNILCTNSTLTTVEHTQGQEENAGVSIVSTEGSVGGAIEAQEREQNFHNDVGRSSNGFREMEQMHDTTGFRAMEQILDTNSSIHTASLGSASNQTITNIEEQNPHRLDNEDGIFFSALVRQLMPLLLQNASAENSLDSSMRPSSSTESVEDQRLTDARSHHDSPDAPALKRQKRD